MTKSKTATRYIAINSHRTSTSEGFGNTWQVFRCTAADQRRLLAIGLPTADSELLDIDGQRYPARTTMGIRLATRQEVREALRAEEHGDRIATVSF